jgi:hypothetical protein
LVHIYNNSTRRLRPEDLEFEASLGYTVKPFLRKPRVGWAPVAYTYLATQEAAIRKMAVQSQPGQIVQETLSQNNPLQKRVGGVAQSVKPEFKPQYH